MTLASHAGHASHASHAGARTALVASLLGSLLIACGGEGRVRPASTPPLAATSAPSSATATATAPPASREALPFIHDDYPRALAEARRTNRPIFVDAWAPWCHSCLSMREYVLTDPRLAPLADQFVWLTIDTERESNAAFVARFENRVWPTLWIIDVGEQVGLRWEGTASAPELIALLASARSGGAADTTVAFLRANQAASRGDNAEAERGYQAVRAVKDAPERARAIEALVGLLAARKDFEACAELALAEAGSLPAGTSLATLVATSLGCARDGKLSGAALTLANVAETIATEGFREMMADDRSALFEEIVETRQALGDEVAAKATARAWARFLEGEAKRAPSRAARAVFDAHRLSAYLAAGEPARALPMLAESERDFPDDYNPPARLARVHLTMRALDAARAAIERASARVYGPRSLRVFALAADIAKARGDRAAERAALAEASSRTARAALTEGQKKLRAELEQRLRELPPL
jgi:thiol-disulfide isomerase/thioredoxin